MSVHLRSLLLVLLVPSIAMASEPSATLGKLGLSLHKRSEGDGSSSPAKLSVTYDAQADSTAYQLDGFLQFKWTDMEGRELDPVTFFGSFEAHLDSANAAADDTLTARAGVGYNLALADDTWTIQFNLAAELNGDRTYDTKSVEGSLEIIPASLRGPIGVWDQVRGSWYYRIAPVVSASYGSRFTDGDSVPPEDKKHFRAKLSLGAGLAWIFWSPDDQKDDFKKGLSLQLNVAAAGWALPNSSLPNHVAGRLDADLDIVLTDSFSLGLGYTFGKEPPAWDLEHTLEFTAGVKFGSD